MAGGSERLHWLQQSSHIFVPASKVLFQIFWIRMTGDLNIMQELAELEQRRFEVKPELSFISKSFLLRWRPTWPSWRGRSMPSRATTWGTPTATGTSATGTRITEDWVKTMLRVNRRGERGSLRRMTDSSANLRSQAGKPLREPKDSQGSVLTRRKNLRWMISWATRKGRR